MSAVVSVMKEDGFGFLGWRDVPTDEKVLGEQARDAPGGDAGVRGRRRPAGADLERKLYLVRKQVQQRVAAAAAPDEGFYVASLSGRTVVYKGMLMGEQVSGFYRGSRDQPALTSAVAVVHQRYSTNTFPSWELAQPFRFLAHNGEINTLRGNLNRMQAREQALPPCDAFGEDIRRLFPVIEPGGSDSACLDNALELLATAGRSLPHAMMMLIPQAWGRNTRMGPDQQGFFEYHAGLMEPWDGPAAVAFTDGASVGAMLDRNGLRPARYTITKDGFMVLASEAGVLDIPPEKIAREGRAAARADDPGGPRASSRVIEGRRDQAPARAGGSRTARGWRRTKSSCTGCLRRRGGRRRRTWDAAAGAQKLFGYTREDLQHDPRADGGQGHEPVGSMGNDTPLAVLSEKPQLLFALFQAALRPGHEPADRPDPRGTGDVAR